MAHSPQCAAALGNQRIAGGQQRHGERMGEAPRYDHDPQPVLLGGIEDVAALIQHHRCNADRRLLGLRHATTAQRARAKGQGAHGARNRQSRHARILVGSGR